jgi:hypothetical protein
MDRRDSCGWEVRNDVHQVLPRLREAKSVCAGERTDFGKVCTSRKELHIASHDQA